MECVDVVVLVPNEDGYSLLAIRRGKSPFAGMWALPGGKVNAGEDEIEAAIRELREETEVSLTEDDLGYVGAFDKPGRDPRWEEAISYAYFALLNQLPAIKAGDDAIECQWIHVSHDGKVLGGLAFDHEEIVRSAVWTLVALCEESNHNPMDL